jgi:quercetin dioxygenase-like cupin family protein
MAKRYFIRERDVPTYHPANHSGTTNRRLIGPETVGAKNVEVVLGVIEKNEGAAPHAHPDMEQVCYMLEGTAVAEVAGERCELKAGDSCYFPAGAMHKFIATSDTPVKVLVIYSPPYGESPERVVRPK